MGHFLGEDWGIFLYLAGRIKQYRLSGVPKILRRCGICAILYTFSHKDDF